MNNVANINDVSNSVKATPSILHCGTPVITTGIMAKLYGTDEANVKMNFSRNADRFIEGKHYFKLEGVELKGFKDRVTESYPVKFHDQIVGKRARSLTLWTERGAARHAKMLDTDQAWDVFEALEDFYFTKKQEPQHKSTVQERNPLKNAVNLLVSKKGIMYPEAYSLVHQQFNVSGIDELTADQIPMAVEYVHKLVMEGEYIPKQDELPLSNQQITDDELITLCWQWNYLSLCCAAMSEVYPILHAAEHRLEGRYYDMPKEASRANSEIRKLLDRLTRHIEPKQTDNSRILNRLRLDSLPA